MKYSRARASFLPAEAAEGAADALADAGPSVIASRAERRAAWRAAGIANADPLPLHPWDYPEELLPAIASLSEDAADRARRLVEESWPSPSFALDADVNAVVLGNTHISAQPKIARPRTIGGDVE